MAGLLMPMDASRTAGTTGQEDHPDFLHKIGIPNSYRGELSTGAVSCGFNYSSTGVHVMTYRSSGQGLSPVTPEVAAEQHYEADARRELEAYLGPLPEVVVFDVRFAGIEE